jgi:hypothetical protein
MIAYYTFLCSILHSHTLLDVPSHHPFFLFSLPLPFYFHPFDLVSPFIASPSLYSLPFFSPMLDFRFSQSFHFSFPLHQVRYLLFFLFYPFSVPLLPSLEFKHNSTVSIKLEIPQLGTQFPVDTFHVPCFSSYFSSSFLFCLPHKKSGFVRFLPIVRFTHPLRIHSSTLYSPLILVLLFQSSFLCVILLLTVPFMPFHSLLFCSFSSQTENNNIAHYDYSAAPAL